MNRSPSSKTKARQRILDAAMESFQTLGYARTTTQIIAEKAEVAEVTIFRHFGNKQKLFQTVVAQIGSGAAFDQVEANLSGDLLSDLRQLSKQMLTFFQLERETIRMLMFESSHFPEMQEALAQNPRRQLELLMRYFQRQIEAGKLKSADPQALAQAFISMHFGYAVGLEPIKEILPLTISREETAEQFVNIFINGAA